MSFTKDNMKLVVELSALVEQLTLLRDQFLSQRDQRLSQHDELTSQRDEFLAVVTRGEEPDKVLINLKGITNIASGRRAELII